ncbi:MAG TPA: DUF6655 family protein [Opitutales bacterium]|nr:DUF6655 family protein [Opitutales bacterium]
MTEPARSGIEQLLLSQAVDDALSEVEVPQVQGKRVFLSDAYYESYDSAYVLGAIRAVLSENGAHLVADSADADIIVEARSGALGIDSSSSLLGVPSIPIVIPAAGSIKIPDLALYKSEKADSISKLAMLAYEAESGEPVFSTDSFTGKARFHHYRMLFFFDINFTDLPERKRY